MKTDDLGSAAFPRLEHCGALSLRAATAWMVTPAVMIAAAALMFAPIVFVDPLRVQLRGLTIACPRLVRPRRAGDRRRSDASAGGVAGFVATRSFPRPSVAAAFALGVKTTETALPPRAKSLL